MINKKINIFIICLLILVLMLCSLVGCSYVTSLKGYAPQHAFYTYNDSVEIYNAEIDSNLGSDAVKYIKINMLFINNSNENITISLDNINAYYEGIYIRPFMHESLDYFYDVVLEPNKSFSGYVWFKVPIDLQILYVEYTAIDGFAMFPVRV